MRNPFLLAAAMSAACAADVAPSNPYDPESPQSVRLPGAILGSVVAPTLTSPAGIEVHLALASGQGERVERTDGAGVFRFGEVAAGTWTLQIAHPEFQALRVYGIQIG